MSDQAAETSLALIREIANSAAGNAMQKMRSISTCCALFADTLIGSACPPLQHLAAMPASAPSAGFAPMTREICTHGQEIATEVAPGLAPVNWEIWPENSTEFAPAFAPEVGHEEAELGFDLQAIATEVTTAVAPEVTAAAPEYAPGVAPDDAEIGPQSATAWQQIVSEGTYWQDSQPEDSLGFAPSATATEVAPAFAPASAKARPRTSGQVMSATDQEEEQHNNRKKKRILLDLLHDRGYLSRSSSSSMGPRPSSSKGSKGP